MMDLSGILERKENRKEGKVFLASINIYFKMLTVSLGGDSR